MSAPVRLRLKLPSGAELEAEGSEEFIRAERREFLDTVMTGSPSAPASLEGGIPPSATLIPWNAITEIRGHNIQLRSKLRGERNDKDACLVLLAASAHLISQPKPTAAQLAKWMRGSGYPVGRMDRMLQAAVEHGEVLSSGSRRSRRYELTASGRLRAFLQAEKLGQNIFGKPA